MTTHGFSSRPEYITWQNMKRRCLDPRAKDYKFYGGAGITICQSWARSFEAFIEDMGPKPEGCKVLDRIDTTKGYNKENCRWTSQKINLQNAITSRVWSVNGREYNSARDAGNSVGVSHVTLMRWCKENKPGFSVKDRY